MFRKSKNRTREKFELKLDSEEFLIKIPLRDNWLSKLKMFIIGFFV